MNVDGVLHPSKYAKATTGAQFRLARELKSTFSALNLPNFPLLLSKVGWKRTTDKCSRMVACNALICKYRFAIERRDGEIAVLGWKLG